MTTNMTTWQSGKIFYKNPQTTFWKCATSVKVWHAAAMAALISATRTRKGGDRLIKSNQIKSFITRRLKIDTI